MNNEAPSISIAPGPLPSELAEPLAAAADRMRPFGRVLWYPVVTSTNTIAAELAERGAAEGTVLIADAQSAGRGRLGRRWVSPPGVGLYVSAILRPPIDVWPFVTIAAGVALADGILRATGLQTVVKWPNDVYVGARKVAGILAERRSGGGSDFAVLGWGINVLPASYPPELGDRATSIEAELGRPVDRGELLAACLCEVADRYADLLSRRFDETVAAWRERAALTFGRAVEWDAGSQTRRGVAVDVDRTGALLVRTAAGIERIISGEVRWA